MNPQQLLQLCCRCCKFKNCELYNMTHGQEHLFVKSAIINGAQFTRCAPLRRAEIAYFSCQKDVTYINLIVPTHDHQWQKYFCKTVITFTLSSPTSLNDLSSNHPPWKTLDTIISSIFRCAVIEPSRLLWLSLPFNFSASIHLIANLFNHSNNLMKQSQCCPFLLRICCFIMHQLIIDKELFEI